MTAMSWNTLLQALEYWRLLRQIGNPPCDLEEVESFVLRATPRTIQDAACILEVVCAYGGDARSDYLDRDALARVQVFLSSGSIKNR